MRAISASLVGELDEGHVRTRLDHRVGAIDRGVEAENRAGVSARDNLEILILPRINGRLHLAQHLVERNDMLAVEMAAFFRKLLILDLNPGSARALKHLHSANRVERVAKARIGVDQQRKTDHVRDRIDVRGDLAQRRQADVRHTKIHVGDAGAGYVNRLESGILDHPREQPIGGSGEHNRFTPRQYRLEGCSPLHCAHSTPSVIVHRAFLALK